MSEEKTDEEYFTEFITSLTPKQLEKLKEIVEEYSRRYCI